jgi:hypothetical protein
MNRLPISQIQAGYVPHGGTQRKNRASNQSLKILTRYHSRKMQR